MSWVTRETVRFRDCDAMGHVNNAVYSTYLEQARITALGGLDPFILARVEIDFRSELHMNDEIEIRTRCRGPVRRVLERDRLFGANAERVERLEIQRGARLRAFRVVVGRQDRVPADRTLEPREVHVDPRT